jgi:hypothetical protein
MVALGSVEVTVIGACTVPVLVVVANDVVAPLDGASSRERVPELLGVTVNVPVLLLLMYSVDGLTTPVPADTDKPMPTVVEMPSVTVTVVALPTTRLTLARSVSIDSTQEPVSVVVVKSPAWSPNCGVSVMEYDPTTHAGLP